MDPNICWIATAVAVVACSFLSLALGALASYSLARFEQLLAPDEIGPMRRFLDEEERLLVGLTVARGLFKTGGLVALTGGFIARRLALAPLEPIGAGSWLWTGAETVALGTLLFVALGHTLPKAVGEGRAEVLLHRLLPALRLLERLTRPLSWLFGGASTVVLRVLNIREVDDKEEAKDDILSAALAGENEGVLDPETKGVIEKLMEFRHGAVAEVMTPRIDIISVDAKSDLDTMLAVALEHKVSRLPVTEGSLDTIVGVLMAKDLLYAIKNPDIEPPSLFRQPYFVPETKRISELLQELRTQKIHMAIVADEYGGTAGLVTIEDLIEEIIGEIDDEKDQPDIPMRRISDNKYDVDAKIPLDDLNEQLSTSIPEDEDVETLGGFIALELGRIPTEGDRVELNGVTFTVTEADERRALRVLMHFAGPPNGSGSRAAAG